MDCLLARVAHAQFVFSLETEERLIPFPPAVGLQPPNSQIQIAQDIFKRPTWLIMASFEQQAVLQIFSKPLIRHEKLHDALAFLGRKRFDFGNDFSSAHMSILAQVGVANN
jgi:hypothetical protein